MRSRHYKSNEPEQFLKQELDQLKNEDSLLQPCTELEGRLLRAMRTGKKNSGSWSKFWMKAAAVFVLSLLCGTIWILKPELRQPSRPEIKNGNVDAMNGYLPLTYGLTPEESLQRVRVKLPRSALNDFGISLKKIRSDEVTADLLVGESGLPYAIRVVQQN